MRPRAGTATRVTRGVALAVVPAVLVLAAGCSGSATTAGSATPTSSPASGSPAYPGAVKCPTPAPVKVGFPQGTSATLPHPSFATGPSLIPAGVPGVQLLHFSTQMSIRDAVLFVLDRYPAAGYTLGRGDAETAEADAPFISSGVRGTTRLSELGACRTDWLVATVKLTDTAIGTTPLLTPHTAAASPLPFGP